MLLQAKILSNEAFLRRGSIHRSELLLRHIILTPRPYIRLAARHLDILCAHRWYYREVATLGSDALLSLLPQPSKNTVRQTRALFFVRFISSDSLAIFAAILRVSVVVVVRASVGATIDPSRRHPSPPVCHVRFGLILAERDRHGQQS
jgi:hypothetical protein